MGPFPLVPPCLIPRGAAAARACAATLAHGALLGVLLAGCEPSAVTNFSFNPVTTTNEDFAEPVFYAVGNTPSTLALADLDGDGDLDAAVVNRFESPASINAPAAVDAPGTVTILDNAGDGTFSVLNQFDVGLLPGQIEVGHFNGDALPDLALLTSNSSVVTVLLNQGGGAFARTDYHLGGTVGRLAVTDLNGDGTPYQDVVASLGEAFVVLQPTGMVALVNNGAGGFRTVASTTEPASAAPSPVRFAVADYDGDGNQDVAALDVRLGTVKVVLGDGAGGFTSPPPPGDTSLAMNTLPFDIATADFNSDGLLDLMVTARTQLHLWLFLGIGGGAFERSPFTPIDVAESTGPPERLLLGNFTSDGVDIAVVQRSGAYISFYDGDGQGAFTLSAIALSLDPFAADKGDFNGDGLLDLVTLENTFRIISIMAGDGEAGFTRTVIGMTERTVGVQVADLNGDRADDLMLLQPNADRVAVFLNCHPAGAPACRAAE